MRQVDVATSRRKCTRGKINYFLCPRTDANWYARLFWTFDFGRTDEDALNNEHEEERRAMMKTKL
jgi:hypothetical protein